MQHPQFGARLGEHQPAIEAGDLQQGEQPGDGDQHAEQPPRIANAVGAAGVQRTAQHQPGQIGGEHHGEGIGARAHELHDGLRPHHLVAQRHATGHAVQGDGQARRRGARRRLRSRRFGQAFVATPGQPGAARGEQVKQRGGAGAAGHAELRQQHEGGQQRPADGAGGIRRIQPAAGFAQLSGGRRQGAHQHRQRAAHEERGQADQGERQQPGERADPLFQPGERAGRVGQGKGCADAEQRHAQLQPGVQAHGPAQPVGPAAEHQPAQGQPGEEGTDAGGDGVDLHPHHQGKLLDPEHLVDQRGGAGDEQQGCGEQEPQGQALAGTRSDRHAGRHGRRTSG
ncbi:hypothetical protein D3C76_828960 [compost metagenome]